MPPTRDGAQIYDKMSELMLDNEIFFVTEFNLLSFQII